MALQLSNCKRFLHWGPLSTIVIIKCITLTTLYMNSMWWPPNSSLGAFINQAMLLLISTLASYNYAMATLTGPGFLPKHWEPKYLKDTMYLQYCKACEGYKAPRSHHCRKCNLCTKKMDHHCPWINNCVGWANHAYFTYFLAFSIIGSFHAAVILVCSFYRGIHRYWYLTHGYDHLATVVFSTSSIILCIFAMGLAIGVIIALSMLLYFQLKSIVRNQTGIEIWIVEKALYRRYQNPSLDDFVYPYDLGTWQNLTQVFNNNKRKAGDGIEWPVVEGCDQYTLTCEQLAQKEEKRARTKTFKCIRPATGRFLPLFSQGWRVCLSPPCTDEARIRLQPDDIIKVTRFRKHWLFGERVLSEKEIKSGKKRKGAIRGWFPRRCAIPITEPNSNASNEDSEDPIDEFAPKSQKNATLHKQQASAAPNAANGKQSNSTNNLHTGREKNGKTNSKLNTAQNSAKATSSRQQNGHQRKKNL